MRYIKPYLDLLGFSASFLCAIHCLAMPFILSAGLATSASWLESPWVEWAFIISTLIMASWSLISSFYKHRNSTPSIIALGGFIIILSVHLLHGHVAHYVAATGGAAIAYAHYINWRLLQKNLPLKTAAVI